MGKQRKGIKITPELIEEITKLVDERIRITYVKRDDFEGLKEIVRQLSENVLSLAEAQRRTQEEFVLFREMTEENFRKVWEAINQLTIRVDQLAEAQRRTEERLDAFERTTEENFKRVWESINQLMNIPNINSFQAPLKSLHPHIPSSTVLMSLGDRKDKTADKMQARSRGCFYQIEL